MFNSIAISNSTHAEHVYAADFDDDGTLDARDLEKLVNSLTGETDDTRLTAEEMRQLLSNVSVVEVHHINERRLLDELYWCKHM